MSLNWMLCVLKCFMTSIRRQSSEDPWPSLSLKFYPSHCGTSLHQAPMFYFTAKCLVVFKIYFAILHNIVARNNVQRRIRLNKQKKKVSHICIPSRYLCYTSRSFALSTWPHGRDVETCERCVVIFFKTVKGVMFDINLTFIGYLVKYYGYIWVYLYWYICWVF